MNRELAMFSADHGIDLPGALRRIKEEYGRRPANLDVLETYAWVLFKAGRASEAVPCIERALAMNNRSFSLLAHASAICEGAGMHDRAAALARSTG